MERGIRLLMGIVSHRAASSVDNMGSSPEYVRVERQQFPLRAPSI